MKRDSLLVLFARGMVSALAVWKALAFVLLLNALLALALVQPLRATLHDVLDRHPDATRLTTDRLAVLYGNLERHHRDVLGSPEPWDALVSGEAPKGDLASMKGTAGALLWLGLVSALCAAIFGGGFAGRFGASRDAGSLSAFGADSGRFAFSSLLLGALSATLAVLLYRFVFVATGSLYEPTELRYEWESIALTLLRLAAFLVLYGYVRLVVIYARAAIGLSRNGNPFLALATGLGFVAGRPLRTMALEVLFGASGLLPLVLWGLLAPNWDGSDPVRFAILLVLQEVLLLLRMAARVAHLGAAVSFMRRVKEAPKPAVTRLEAAPASAA